MMSHETHGEKAEIVEAELVEQATPSTVPPSPVESAVCSGSEDKARKNKGSGLGGVFVMGCMLCFASMLCGVFMVLWWNKGSGSSAHGAESYVLNKEKIAELALVQEGIDYKNTYDSEWMQKVLMWELPIDKASIVVSGKYLIKYGLDIKAMKVWEYYPATNELQISSPIFQVLSVETLSKSVVEDNGLLKKLSDVDRNNIDAKHMKHVQLFASERLSSSEIRKECESQLTDIMQAFGIRLIVVPDIPTK